MDPAYYSNQASKSAGLLLFVLIPLLGCKPEPIELRATIYPENADAKTCPVAGRQGSAGLTDDQSTEAGTRYNVRTPLNYDATRAHPLLVVYAPAGRSRGGNERFTKLTPEATEAGFIVVYADNKRLSETVLLDFGSIPEIVSQQWCIDNERIYFTGHSDGGTVSMGLAFTEETKHLPAAVAPSASGIKSSDLTAYSCPDPISILIMHSADDSLFPGFGAETAGWWASCNQCDSVPGKPDSDGCIHYRNCANNVSTVYCEGHGAHGEWPNINPIILAFLDSRDKFNSINAKPKPEELKQ